MPPRLSKPENVPAKLKPLVDYLWRFHARAYGPPVRAIADVIRSMPEDRAGTANPETVRRTLKGLMLPTWHTVEVIFLALCELADVDPDDHDDPDDSYYEGTPPTHREELEDLYHHARFGDVGELPKTRSQRAREEAQRARERQAAAQRTNDPWGPAPF